MYSFAKADVSFSLFPLKASRILVTSIGSLIISWAASHLSFEPPHLSWTKCDILMSRDH